MHDNPSSHLLQALCHYLGKSRRAAGGHIGRALARNLLHRLHLPSPSTGGASAVRGKTCAVAGTGDIVTGPGRHRVALDVIAREEVKSRAPKRAQDNTSLEELLFAIHASCLAMALPDMLVSGTAFAAEPMFSRSVVVERVDQLSLKEESMAVYMLLTKLSPDAIKDPKTYEELGRRVTAMIHKDCPQVKWISSYTTLGPYDYVDTFEAPDSDSATKVALIIRSMGHATTETWLATPYERFIDMTREVGR